MYVSCVLCKLCVQYPCLYKILKYFKVKKTQHSLTALINNGNMEFSKD